MKKLLTFSILLLLLISLDVSGQDSVRIRWEFSVGGGLSFPAGVYSKKNPEESVIINYTNDSIKQYVGFSKENSGFAKSGWSYNATIKYQLSSGIKLFIVGGEFINPVNTGKITDYLSRVTDLQQEFKESAYKVFYLIPGIEYLHQFNRLSIGLSFHAGYSKTNFPNYKIIYLFETVNPKRFFGHIGPEPYLSSLTIGSGLSITYQPVKRFKISLNTIYQHSNFPYHMSNEVYPAGGGRYEIDDILKVRVINTDVVLSYVF